MTTPASPLVDQTSPDDLSKYLVPKQAAPTGGRGGTPVTQTPTGGRGTPQTAPQHGLVEPGNIDLYNRPHHTNPNGSVSTVLSKSWNLDGKETLLPTIADDGHPMSDDEAIQQYKKTGKHLGKFDSVASANAYGEQLHNEYAAGKYGKPQSDDLSKYLVPKAEQAVPTYPSGQPAKTGDIQHAPNTPVQNVNDSGAGSDFNKGEYLHQQPNETDDQWARRQATAAKTVTQPQIDTEAAADRKRVPAVLGTALAMGAALPLLPAAIEAPAATAIGLGASALAGKGAKEGTKALGGGEEVQNWAELLGGLAGGVGAAKAVAPVSEAASKFWNTPERAGKIYQRAVAPNGQSAADEEAMQENFQRAAKHIAPETRAVDIPKGEGGVMRAADVVNQAGNRLWEQRIQPVVDVYKNRVDDVSSVAKDIRDSFTDLDKTTNPSKVEAGENLAQAFDRNMTVGEMADQVKQLNNDKSVSRYYNMSDIERTQAELGDPSLRAKVAALNSLRGKLIESVGKFGGKELGESFAEDRKDWGALRTVQGQLENARVPTPAGLASRAANTVRSVAKPQTEGVKQSLFNSNNPNKLAPRSLNMLGKTKLAPSAQPPITVPGTPQNPVTDVDHVMSAPKVEAVPQGRYSGPEQPPVPAKGTELPAGPQRKELPAEGGSHPPTPAGPITPHKIGSGRVPEPATINEGNPPQFEPPAQKTSINESAPPAQLAKDAGLIYKDEAVRGTGVQQFEDPSRPGKTMAISAEQMKTMTPEKLRAAMDEHLKDFPVVDKGTNTKMVDVKQRPDVEAVDKSKDENDARMIQNLVDQGHSPDDARRIWHAQDIPGNGNNSLYPASDKPPKPTIDWKPTATSKSDSLATYKSLPDHLRSVVDDQAEAIEHMPQMLRESRMKEVDAFGQAGTPFKEKLAIEIAKQEKLPVTGSTARAGTLDLDAEIKRMDTKLRDLRDKVQNARSVAKKMDLTRQQRIVSDRIKDLMDRQKGQQ